MCGFRYLETVINVRHDGQDFNYLYLGSWLVSYSAKLSSLFGSGGIGGIIVIHGTFDLLGCVMLQYVS